MPTGKQIRAARMLLEWDADDLAEKSGFTRETIFKIERGVTQPRPTTMDVIVKTFKAAGVEFNGDRGVNLILEDYRLLEGADFYLKLLDEIYYELRGKKDAEVIFIGVDDSVSSPETIAANKRLLGAGIKCRYLCSEEAKKFDYNIEDYRVVPKERFKNSVMISFGDKVITLRGHKDEALIIRDKEQAEMLQGLFEIIWAQAQRPKRGK